MKQIIFAVSLFFCNQNVFAQNAETYKYTITLRFPNKQLKNDSSQLDILIKSKFEISSKNKLSDSQLEEIKKCLLTNTNNPGICGKKDEYIVDGIL